MISVFSESPGLLSSLLKIFQQSEELCSVIHRISHRPQQKLVFFPISPYEDDMKSYLSHLTLPLTAAVRIEKLFLTIMYAFEIILCLRAPKLKIIPAGVYYFFK